MFRKAPRFGRWLIRNRTKRRAARGLRRRPALQAEVQPVGPAACAWSWTATCSTHISDGPRRGGHRPHRPRRRHGHRAAVGRPPRRRRDRHRDGIAAAGARRHHDRRRRRGGQADRPVRLQGVPARGRPEHGVVHRLHQRVVDAARRHDRARPWRSCWPTWTLTATPTPTRTWARCRSPRSRRGTSTPATSQRAPHALPKSGTRRPWNVRHNYVLDVIDHRFDRIEESMVFGRAAAAPDQPLPRRNGIPARTFE